MKNRILSFLRMVNQGLVFILNTLSSVIRILLYSSSNINYSELLEIKKTVFVLGNGPSLKEIIDDNLEFLSAQNLVVVNDFFFNKNFTTLKPKVYVIADPGYWESQVSPEMVTLTKEMHEKIINGVTWEMFFFVPTPVYKTNHFQQAFKSNTNIKVMPFNATAIISSKPIRYFFYDKLLAKPFSGNVIGSALFISLQMDVEKILLFGVEHSWSKSLFVDEQNRTCIVNEHFYTNIQESKVWLKSNAEPYRIYEALRDISVMLGGYKELDEYARYRGINIYNCTLNSFIDSFERKKYFRE